MLNTVILYENALDFSEHEIFEVENVVDFLMTRFEKWPDNGRIYFGDVSAITDVTPIDEEGIEKLLSLNGKFHCVIYPEAVLLPYAAYIIAAVLFVAALVMMPNVPTVTQRNSQNPSPNNELSSRSNRARVNGRIPDIFGEVRSTPDLIAQTYSTFINHQEVEYTLMVVGRGQYEIFDSYDGETPISQIAGSTVQAYLPFTNPVFPYSTVAPYYIVGNPIEEEFFNCIRSNSVNGQALRAPNYNRFVGANDVTFTYPNKISIPIGSGRTLDNYFNVGDNITIENADKYAGSTVAAYDMKVTGSNTIRFKNASIPSGWAVSSFVTLINGDFNVPDLGSGGWVYHLSGTYEITSISTAIDGTDPVVDVSFELPNLVNSHWNEVAEHGASNYGSINTSVNTGALIYSLDGTYNILSLTETEILLNNPVLVNSDWNAINGAPFTNTSAVLTANGINWVGPFILENTERKGIISNFVALNGLYADDGTNQYELDVTIRVELTPVNIFDVPTGPAEILDVTVHGSSIVKDTRAATLQGATTFTGRCRIRAARITNRITGFNGQVVDEIKWRDLYTQSYFEIADFGNVTCVRTKSFATAGALSVKERKLNMLVNRQIKLWTGGTSFTPDLHTTKRAKDIAFHIALDDKIGNRSLSEIDFQSFHDNMFLEPNLYFDTENACEFCYTFDKTNLTFEETITTVGAAVYNVVYRLGNVLKCSFEKATENSTLIFNHRNKIPGSETRTVTFGNQNDNDGIEFEYVDPSDDAVVTYYLPEDRSAQNPKKIQSVGVRNYLQAHFHAWRHFNKIRYQNIQVEFDATQEADMSIPTDRILVADNTRTGTQDGEIESMVGLVVYTSQALAFSVGITHTMFLQLRDGTVQAITATPGPIAASATLAGAPNLPLVVDNDAYAKTTYILVASDDVRKRAFLVTEKITQDNMTSKIRAANYDARFYGHDEDHKNGIV